MPSAARTLSKRAVVIAATTTGFTTFALCNNLRDPGGKGGQRSSLLGATGKVPEWGTEQVNSVRADWACIGANQESEDRMVIVKNGEGVVYGVFDGHYGPRASEFCRANTPSLLAQASEGLTASQSIVRRLFQLFENGWIDHSRILIRRGDWSASLEGSCALVAHVTREKVVVGNLGDCRAILISEGEDGKHTAIQVTREHNASNAIEREKILREHPDEVDAVQFVQKSGSWYVKGTLQVSRAIGDLFLKDYEFNKALPDHVRPYVGGELKSPPYVSVSPDFFEIPITKKEKMLVLASDGLWDELTNDECAKILDK
ncbi:hypothetical protein GUITHDRAFT_110199 [Guillardia theta CCMP2712]|uniref:PPM-type phosphatase domain-containing protein n=1 Tax=Guillardia theta (strain CCMP2712) TaxID=905079 RepID=L1J6L8_GUITC|nr:hypothetical protein GUITHDRAFT_110199 [Guillardia theta CCMP2712]EKX43744.1 hypothetical protein GUITHDRAFT_110199 [Guillardia theta CCMP2712]|eukprot:XP_005830724.1 hypothetical protein GUITHDRAFT_110199 [Guillardia theta CCMP2712]